MTHLVIGIFDLLAMAYLFTWFGSTGDFKMVVGGTMFGVFAVVQAYLFNGYSRQKT